MESLVADLRNLTSDPRPGDVAAKAAVQLDESLAELEDIVRRLGG
jgi:hypothetical protein